MAGSYKHLVNRSGAFIGTRLLDHMGDAFEALEELYGMVWLLAHGNPEEVERARAHYTDGLKLAPTGDSIRRAPSVAPVLGFRLDSEWARMAVSLLRKEFGNHQDDCSCKGCTLVREWDARPLTARPRRA